MRWASREPPRARRSTPGASAAIRATGSGEPRMRRARAKPVAPMVSQPLSSDAEGRALVPEERSPASRARPSPARVTPEGHGSRAGEQENTHALAERAEVGCLRVGDDADPTRERAKSPLLAPALGAGPHSLRRHH